MVRLRIALGFYEITRKLESYRSNYLGGARINIHASCYSQYYYGFNLTTLTALGVLLCCNTTYLPTYDLVIPFFGAGGKEGFMSLRQTTINFYCKDFAKPQSFENDTSRRIANLHDLDPFSLVLVIFSYSMAEPNYFPVSLSQPRIIS